MKRSWTRQLFSEAAFSRARRTHRWKRASAQFFSMNTLSQADRMVLLGIYTLETYYRPLPCRLAEYGLLLWEGLLAPFRGGQVKNYTIGPCQIGLSTLLRYRNCDVPLHCQRVRLPSCREFLLLFRAAGTAYSAELLAYRLQDAMRQAKQRYPARMNLQCRVIGQEFAGRYSYGLMLERAYGYICDAYSPAARNRT